jgi:hypothetical protein
MDERHCHGHNGISRNQFLKAVHVHIDF